MSEFENEFKNEYHEPTDGAQEPSALWDKDAWELRGRDLSRRDGDTRWELGDWLLEGDGYCRNVYDEGEYVTGLQRGTLKDLASVAKRIPACVRTHDLKWSHHRVLANAHKKGEPPLTPEQIKDWLDKAVAGERLDTSQTGPWTVAELQAALKRGEPTMPGKNTTRITIELPNPVYREFLYLVLDGVNGDPLLYMDAAARQKHVENEYNFTPSTPKRHPPLRAKHVNLFATDVLTKLVQSEEGKGTISFVKRAWTVLADGDVLRARKPRKIRKIRLSKAVRDAERATRKREAERERRDREAERERQNVLAAQMPERTMPRTKPPARWIRDSEKARKLLAAFLSLAGKSRASALTFFRRFDEKYANNFVVDHALRVAVQEVLAVEPAPVRRKKSPAVGGIRKISKAAALRERIADASAAVEQLPAPAAAPELDEPGAVGDA